MDGRRTRKEGWEEALYVDSVCVCGRAIEVGLRREKLRRDVDCFCLFSGS